MISSHGSLVYGLSFAISLVSFYSLLLSPSIRSKNSSKYAVLSVFTVAQSVMVAFLTVLFPSNIVMKAVLSTVVSVASITGYAATSKRDLTELGSFLYSFTTAFVVYQLLRLLSMANWISFDVPWNEMLGCSLGAALAATYLAFHTKMIFASKDQKYKFARSDHVLAAVCIYNDVINLFVYMLRLMAENQKKN